MKRAAPKWLLHEIINACLMGALMALVLAAAVGLWALIDTPSTAPINYEESRS